MINNRHRAAYVALLILIMVAPTVSAEPLQRIHDALLANFTPVVQTADEEVYDVIHDGTEPFSGDCDDYYVAAYIQAEAWGYKPFAILGSDVDSGQRHIMACVKDGGLTKCLDNTRSKLLKGRAIRQAYTNIEIRRAAE